MAYSLSPHSSCNSITALALPQALAYEHAPQARHTRDAHLEAGLNIESSAFFETMLSDDGLLAMQTYVDLPYEKRRDWIEHPTNPGYKDK